MKNEERRMKNSRQREDSLLHTKSYDFALRIVGMNKYLREQKGEFVLSKQILSFWNSHRSINTRIGICTKPSRLCQ